MELYLGSIESRKIVIKIDRPTDCAFQGHREEKESRL